MARIGTLVSCILPLCISAASFAQLTPINHENAVQRPTELLVMLQPGTDANDFGLGYGVTPNHQLLSDPDAFVFDAGNADNAAAQLPKMQADVRVRAAYFNEHTQYVKSAFVPNDPLFHHNTPVTNARGQWHLINELTPGRDANVQGAWNADITGTGVIIGIVDDCLQTTHPDLAPNYDAADSWNFGQNNANPDPVNSSDEHGISVAGVAAARGGNGIGVTGAAPFANLAGLRVDFVTQTTQMFVDATQYHSIAGNAIIGIKNHSYGYSVPYVTTTAELAAINASAAAGTVHCVAAGNNRQTSITGNDSNKMMLQNSPDVICVAAMDASGVYSYYSCFGACVFCCAPSDGFSNYGITTTDRTGTAGYNGFASSTYNDYTDEFGGTSSATPLVSGVLALAKQVAPNMNVRLAKHMLVRTCTVVDANNNDSTSDGGWKTNAAGYKFNQNYGFGLINASSLVTMASSCASVTPLTTASTGNVSVGASIPDNSTNGVVRTFTLNPANAQPLEDVQVTLNVSHSNRGEVEAYLTSPSGTTSRLMYRSPTDTPSNINWTFTTNAFWGEPASGTWSLKVMDVIAGTTGTWTSYSATIRMGDMVCDAIAPVAQGVSGVSPNGSYRINTNVDMKVTFSEPVLVTGTPRIRLQPGTTVRFANYLSGSGSNQLVFRYTVAAGDEAADLDYIDDTALRLNGGTIKDGAGNDAVLTLPVPGSPGSLSANANYIIDTTAPTIAITSPTLMANYDTNSNTVTLSGTASDNNVVASVTWTSTTGNGTATGTTNWTIPNIPLQPGSNGILVSSHDAAGNTNTTIITVNLDTSVPTIAITTPAAASFDTNAATIDLAGTASDNNLASITWANNRGGSGAATGTANWTITGVPLQSGANVITVTAHDVAGNIASTSVTVNLDTTAPTILIGAPSASTICAGGGSIDYTITYTGATTVSLSNADVSLNTNGAFATFNVTGSGTATRTVTLSNFTGSGTVGISIASGTASDNAGNLALAAGPSGTITVNAGTAAPANVAASDGDFCDKIRVSWDAVAGATGYTVWRHTADDSNSATQIGTPGASPFDDTTAAAGQTYYYWLKATGSCGPSGFSNSNAGQRASAPIGAGDINVDSIVDGDDINAFVTCLLNNSTAGNCARADMNCDGAIDNADAAMLVTKLLAP